MKKVMYLMSIALLGVFASCEDVVREKREYLVNEPIFISAAEFRAMPIQTKSPQEIEEQGKICLYEGFLYISEPGKGIHVIDNRNPASPKAISFIELQGNADIAVRTNKLYANSHIDLVWFDISDPAKPTYEDRLEDAFKYALPIIDNEGSYNLNSCFLPENQGKVVIDWKLTKYEDYYTINSGNQYMSDAANSSSGGSIGVNGSMSRFGIHKDYLYTVMNHTMTIIDLKGEKPVKATEDIPVDWDVETIFSYKEYMFLGTPTGMSIYSVENPIQPERMSTIWHARGCDPVVVEDDIAYITIHVGNFCGQNSNELIIYDVADVRAPKHIVSYGMSKPKGLGVDNKTLFICDDGLKVFDATNPQTIMANQLAHYAGMEGYDVIPYNNVLMMIADDGLYQFDYQDIKKISQLSKIGIKK